MIFCKILIINYIEIIHLLINTIKEWKKLKNEEHPLMLRVTKDGKRKHVSLGISVKPDHWIF
jgi:hypothetical protein